MKMNLIFYLAYFQSFAHGYLDRHIYCSTRSTSPLSISTGLPSSNQHVSTLPSSTFPNTQIIPCMPRATFTSSRYYGTASHTNLPLPLVGWVAGAPQLRR